MSALTKELIQECQRRLLQLKTDLLNRTQSQRLEITVADKMSGDEADQTVAQLAENNFLINHARMRTQLLEVQVALARIENGSFGVCEETSEPIETARLLALPYTRLSIEGAEMRESRNLRYAP